MIPGKSLRKNSVYGQNSKKILTKTKSAQTKRKDFKQKTNTFKRIKATLSFEFLSYFTLIININSLTK